MIYFIGPVGYGLVKIGHTATLRKRLRDLQYGSPVPLIVHATMDGGAEEEAELHATFRPYRRYGEWFEWSDPIRQFVRENGRTWNPIATPSDRPTRRKVASNISVTCPSSFQPTLARICNTTRMTAPELAIRCAELHAVATEHPTPPPVEIVQTRHKPMAIGSECFLIRANRQWSRWVTEFADSRHVHRSALIRQAIQDQWEKIPAALLTLS